MPSYPSHDVALHYDERGVGEPIVVLGGGPARHPDYLGDLGGLGAHATLLLPHLRGVGRSPFPDDPALASWWNQAADIDDLRRHLGVDRISVLGHSAGTRIALAFAARFPGSLERLILVTPPTADLVDVPADVPAIRLRRAGDEVYEAALATAQQGPPSDGDDDRLNAWQRAIAPLSYATWGMAQQDHAGIGRWTAAAIGAYNSVPAPDTFRASLAAVRVPVLVVAALEDGVVGSTGPMALAEVFADGRGVEVPRVGHYPWVDDPDAFVSAVRSLLDR